MQDDRAFSGSSQRAILMSLPEFFPTLYLQGQNPTAAREYSRFPRSLGAREISLFQPAARGRVVTSLYTD